MGTNGSNGNGNGNGNGGGHEAPVDFFDIVEIPASFRRVSDAKKRAYLLAQAVTPSLGIAAQVAGVDVRTLWNWRQRAERDGDKDYLEALECARQMGIAAAETEAWNRAVHGWVEPVFGQISEPVDVERADGKGTKTIWRHRTGVVGEITKKSDTMLIFMLKGAKPEVYRERVEHTGPNGGPIQAQIIIGIPDNGRVRRIPNGDQ